ncbi:MAG: glycine cleavage system protein GcvH [Myxococcales bacterium]|nr:glycine cleavage system protein GcvH [Myxococcales bacterium]MCB9709196.1 glycine cleavage system protein GcvH [Myxococcales bacterium]
MSDNSFPENYFYTKDHEWAREEPDGTLRVGITAFAVTQLGDITLVDLPSPGSRLEAGKRFGDVESVKTVSELFAPVSGEVIEVNQALNDQPELINESAYDHGWLLVLKPAHPSELETLLDAKSYADFVEHEDT